MQTVPFARGVRVAVPIYRGDPSNYLSGGTRRLLNLPVRTFNNPANSNPHLLEAFVNSIHHAC